MSLYSDKQADSTNTKLEEENVIRQQANDIARGLALPMALKAAIELGILDTISDAGAYLSAYELACKIRGCVNPDAPAVIDHILGLLVSFSVLKCKIRSKVTGQEGDEERVYGMAPVSKYFLSNKLGFQDSLAPWLLLRYDKLSLDFWYNLTESIQQGGIPFDKAFGMSLFEYTSKDMRYSKVFNNAMSSDTPIVIEKMLDVYQGFEGINVLVDVGGGVGTTLSLITYKYPNIRGINFDLPHVLTSASAKIYTGVEHVAGDMFEEVPNGDAIILKRILHDWKDAECLKILMNCWKALPKNGKVIVVEQLLPLAPESNFDSQSVFDANLTMFAVLGAFERTIKEYKSLALRAGFSSCHVMCSVNNESLIEFRKD